MKKCLIFAMFLMIGVFFVSPCLVRGQSCGNYSHSYYPQQTYYNNYVTTYKEVLIPLFQPYPVFVDPRISYHYSSGNYLGVALAPSIPGVVAVPTQQVQQNQPSQLQQQVAPKTSANSEDIDSLIDKIERRIRERNKGGRDSRENEQAYEPEGPPMVPGGVSLVNSPKLAARSWVNVLQSNCASCHTGTASKGNTVIFSSPGRIDPSFDAQGAWEAIDEGRMPPKERPRVKASDKDILKRDFGL